MTEGTQDNPQSEETPASPAGPPAGAAETPPPETALPAASTPPATAKPKRRIGRILLLGLGGLVFLFLFFLVSVTILDFTESVPFCSACHIMKPEFTVYRSSPHARTQCGQCHIGPGAVPAVQAKLENIRYVWVYPLKLYKKPIPSPITSLRPVEVVCEQCHWPQKVYEDRLVIKNDYAQDQANNLTRTQLLLRTGGGSQAAGLGRGIHWHIENPVYYIAVDDKRQDIPWVQAQFQGVTTEYISTDWKLTPGYIASAEKRKMDCVDCHNRATHIFRNPDDALDDAMATGLIKADLPFIKQEGMKVLDASYATEDEAAKAIAAVADVYRSKYSDVYSARQADIKAAVSQLQTIFDNTQFPFMNVTWQSHSNNIGHKDFPGCFRCHDGKHLSGDNQVIRLECNICHTIPQVANPGQALPALPTTTGVEPASHRSTTWLAQHRYQFDATCVTCHTTDNPGGNDNSSFCSNGACHGTQWKYVDLNAPKIRELVMPPQPPAPGGPAPIPHPIGPTTNCLICHAQGKVRPFPADHTSYTAATCVSCHKAPTTDTGAAPAASPTAAPSSAGGPPPIPHTLAGRSDCLLCHDIGKTRPFPADHAGRTNDTCQACHKASQ